MFRACVDQLRRTRPWLYLHGGLSGVVGATCLVFGAGRVPASLFQIVIAVISLLFCFRLFRFAGAIRKLVATPDDHHLEAAFVAQKRWWKSVALSIPAGCVLGVLIAWIQ